MHVGEDTWLWPAYMSKSDMVHVTVMCAIFVLWWCFGVVYHILWNMYVLMDVDSDVTYV